MDPAPSCLRVLKATATATATGVRLLNSQLISQSLPDRSIRKIPQGCLPAL